MHREYLQIVLFGFLLTAVSVRVLKKFALKRKIFIPKGIPLVGGVSMGFAFVVAALFGLASRQVFSHESLGIVFASCVMLVLGLMDDWRELSIQSKLLVQLIACASLIAFGVRTHIVYIGTPFNICLTFVWLLGITNAFNHLDIMDGLAAGIALCVSLAFFAIAFINGQVQPAILSLALCGALSGFFEFNFPPARVYMGNSGSHFLGFLLAAIAMMISYAPMERKIALLSPLLILGVPILDTAFLVLMRFYKKILPFKKSNDHLALRLLSLGYSKRKTLCFVLSGAALFSFGGVIISQVSNRAGIMMTGCIAVVSLVFLARISRIATDG